MTPEVDFHRLYTDPDYIALKRFDYSINKLVERYPDGAPPKLIAQALLITEEEVEEIYQGIVLKLREAMVEDGD